MFESVGWGEILVLIVAGLFILGPERLPEAAAWVGRSMRKVRDFASGARNQLKDEMGPEFEDFRKPLEDLRELRNFDPKRVVTKHLFDDDPDPLGLNNINGTAPANGHSTAAATSQPSSPEPLKPGEKPPVDPDAT
ncbi:Sec-independent protein translocase protein TatB [Amycolatopsis suaedae]|uniref:Sec-independent protein translocase protein TatB n=1 Tax=Amycolatopsis suaedae TaxID=2510978 RepID=A0A4Q7J8H0_9PSEU|nr:Sec-independent protein translocase protein TatB [Amycolatopsis suaedae]RZQ62673.1 Sec-independent protein translocase subunit TatB [Amycolatopsis suaedae]